MERISSMTVEEFESVADSLGPCELVKGEVVLMSPGGASHSIVSGKIFGELYIHCEAEKCGRMMTNEAGVVTDAVKGTVRGADVLYISFKRLPRGQHYDGFLRTPPELIAETKSVNDTWKNLKAKVDEYHAIGVDLVWLADPKTRSFRIYPNGKRSIIKHENEWIDGGTILPKFRCKIARFFEE